MRLNNQTTMQKVSAALFKSPKSEALLGVIGFQERIFRRIQCDDIPFFAKLKMINIIHHNISDHLQMKLYDAKKDVNEYARIMITALYEDIDKYLHSLVADYYIKIGGGKAIFAQEMLYSILKSFKDNQTEIVFPFEGYKRVYIFSNSMNYNDDTIKCMNRYSSVVWIETPESILNISNLISYFRDEIKNSTLSNDPFYSLEDNKPMPFYEELDYFKVLDEKKELLIRVPDNDYQMVIDFIEQCCTNENVRSIFMTLYRFKIDGRIVELLKAAVKLGKDVNVFIEPNARGNEAVNGIAMRELRISGVHVNTNFQYKVHAKMFLAITNDDKIYAHFSTGNYNESTGNIYTDLHLFTTDSTKTIPALSMFLSIMHRSGYQTTSPIKIDHKFDKVKFAPIDLKSFLISLIRSEIALGRNGRIFLKVNSLTDNEVIYHLHDAVAAGCEVTIICRSICLYKLEDDMGNTGNRPDIYSICGMNLEHDRIYQFGNRWFIASADLSFRNMHKRVESCIELTEETEINHMKSLKHNLLYNSGVIFKKTDGYDKWIMQNHADVYEYDDDCE